MEYESLTKEQMEEQADLLFTKLSGPEEIRNWISYFLDLDIPMETMAPESTSNPLDAIWQVYESFLHNKSSEESPAGYVLMSCREGMKCQVKGTSILTPNGLKNIEEIKINDSVWTGFSWQKVTNFFDEGVKPAMTVSVPGFPSVTGTPIHRYWVLRDGHEQWVESKNLNSETDLICLNTNTGLSDSGVIDGKKYDLGYFLGLLIGDGGLTLMDSYNRVTLTSIDPYIIDFYHKFVKDNFSNINIIKNDINYVINNKNFVSKLKEYGLKSSYSYEKRIPSICYTDTDYMKGFIAGLFDTDGSWDKKGDCFFEMTCNELLCDLQKVFLSFGIEARIRHSKKLYGLQKHKTTRICIGQTESIKLENLGIIFKAKKARKHQYPKIPNCKDTLPVSQLRDLLDLAEKHTDRSIRNRKNKKPTIRQEEYKTLTVFKIKKLCLWLKECTLSSDEIKVVSRYENILKNKWKKFEIKHDGEQYFYDLTVENEHSYWSNGYISHNTVAVALIELLLFLHFELEIAHAAATETQSTVGLSYIHGFLAKVEPLMIHKGWENLSQNKRTLSFKTPSKKTPYIKILICSPKGMNSLHANVLFLDELDLADPAALKEGRNIVGFSKGIHGKAVYLSTRKYAFGNMADIISKIDDLNYRLLSWNILDVTEKCPASRHKPDEPKITRYVAKNLPLKQIEEEQYNFLAKTEQAKFDKLENVYAGCGKCLLLPVCKTQLSKKDDSCTGGFYKPIVSVIQKFRENDPDTAEAQLLCWKPGSSGLVYPRLVTIIDNPSTNVISVKAAYRILTGQDLEVVTEDMLLAEIKKQDITIDACVDWGFTHEATIGIAALPEDECWALDQFSAPNLEFADFLDIAIKYRDRYDPTKWWCDQARPEYITTFNKNGMKSPKFTKDVIGGISALRSKIVDATGQRKFKIIATEANKKLIFAISRHKFILDALGEPTDKPNDEAQVADICDGWRYLAQNRFPVKGAGKVHAAIAEPRNTQERIAQTQNNSFLKAVQEATGVTVGPTAIATKKKGGFYFSW